jgi:hypothetical protein
MQLTVNVRRSKGPGRVATYVPLGIGVLTLWLVPGDYTDSWLDARWWILVLAWALTAWGAVQMLRRWRRPFSEGQPPN